MKLITINSASTWNSPPFCRRRRRRFLTRIWTGLRRHHRRRRQTPVCICRCRRRRHLPRRRRRHPLLPVLPLTCKPGEV
jgi:hypothetical protein